MVHTFQNTPVAFIYGMVNYTWSMEHIDLFNHSTGKN